MMFLIANDRSCCRQTWRLLQAIRQSAIPGWVCSSAAGTELKSPLPLGPGTLAHTSMHWRFSQHLDLFPNPPSGLPLTSHWPPPDFSGLAFYEIQCSPLNSATQIRVLLARKMWGKGFVCVQPLSSAYTWGKIAAPALTSHNLLALVPHTY